ncbi:MAG: phytoene dehydrogenase, partial [Myxococcales bacterium]|nr:phytoene dehydrogenase [Myxococcales bacterium]
MSQSYFDAIILGTDFEALICGALLTKRGYRVLLAGQDDLPPVYRAGEHSLPHHPFTFLAGHSPMARRIFAELALHQIFRRRAVAIDPPFQVAQPGHRLDLPLDEDERLLEIEREFPEVRRPVEDFHRSVAITSAEIDRIVERDLVWSPSSFLERRELSRAIAHQPFSRRGDVPDPLREIADDHPFRWVVEAPVRFASDLDPDQRPHLSTARLYTAWLHGAATVEGGYAWLRETLIDRIQTHGGEVRPRERAERILVRRGAAAGVRMAR